LLPHAIVRPLPRHQLGAVVAHRFEVVVATAADRDGLHRVLAAFGPGLEVSELDAPCLVAPPPILGHERATPTVPLPDGPANRSRDASLVVIHLLRQLPRSVGDRRLRLQRLFEEQVEGLRHDYRRVTVRKLMSEQVLQPRELLMSVVVDRDLELVAARREGLRIAGASEGR
jgi:hypothetical protein